MLHQVKKSELANFENMVLPENKSVIEIIDIGKDSGRSKQIKFRISTEKENSAKEPDMCTFLELKRILVLHYVTFSSVRFILPTEKIQKVRQNDKVFLLNLSREKFMTVNTFQQRQKKKTVQKKDVLLVPAVKSVGFYKQYGEMTAIRIVRKGD